MGNLSFAGSAFFPIVLMTVSLAVGAYALLNLVLRTRPRIPKSGGILLH